jgi:hypothetical protein
MVGVDEGIAKNYGESEKGLSVEGVGWFKKE